jgi:hypothetical protein
MIRHPQRLVHFIIGKSIVEALLISSVAVAFYLVTTNPNLHGWLDLADVKTVSGWVVDESNPQARVEVQLFIDSTFVESRRAADFRPDVHAANRAQDDWHGFIFNLPALSAGEHEARVYAMHVAAGSERRTLQLIGKPLQFRSAGGETR